MDWAIKAGVVAVLCFMAVSCMVSNKRKVIDQGIADLGASQTITVLRKNDTICIVDDKLLIEAFSKSFAQCTQFDGDFKSFNYIEFEVNHVTNRVEFQRNYVRFRGSVYECDDDIGSRVEDMVKKVKADNSDHLRIINSLSPTKLVPYRQPK